MAQIPDGQRSRPTGSDGFWTWLRDLGIRRGGAGDKWFSGVSSGIARRLGIDPVLVRGVFILLTIFGGIGVLLYLVGWALLPDRHGMVLAEQAIRQRNGRGIVLLVAIGLVVLGNLDGRWWVWTILLPTALLLLWVFRSARAGKSSDEMGKEAQEVAARFGETVSGWTTSAGSTPRPVRDEDTPTLPYAASSPQSGTTTSPPGGLGGTSPDSPTAGAPFAGGSPFGHNPHGMGPGRTGPVAPPAAQPTRVVQRRRRGAGFLGLLFAVGLAVAACVGGQQVATSQAWPGSTPAVFATACALGAIGLAVLLIGLSGRKAGFPGLIGVLLAIVAVSGTATVPDVVRGGAGERTWSAADVAAHGGALGAGDLKLTLSSATPGQQLVVNQGLGTMTITVPKDVTATIDAEVGAGGLTIDRAGAAPSHQDDVTSVTGITVGSGPTKVTVRAHLGAGDLTIKEQ